MPTDPKHSEASAMANSRPLGHDDLLRAGEAIGWNRMELGASNLFTRPSGGPSNRNAAASTPSESQVKAAFVINFAKYVEWPASAFDRTDSPIIIAVLGKSNVAAALQQMIPGRIIDGRNLVMEQLASGAKPGRCHILFVPASEPRLSPGLVADLKNAGVLTVGESGDFLDSGGMINLALRDQRIALEVNLPAADQAGIKLSSKLLSVARVEKGRAH